MLNASWETGAFLAASDAFCRWVETFDPEDCSITEVAQALTNLSLLSDLPTRSSLSIPFARYFKPNRAWQANQRKTSRLVVHGYDTALLRNFDGLESTGCSLAYDLCDFYETLTNVRHDNLLKSLEFFYWDYLQLRMQAARQALLAMHEVELVDPFRLRHIAGRAVRFVGWPTTGGTHATFDAETIRGATTLCGAENAHHKHTHQQWTCFACSKCRGVLLPGAAAASD